MHRAKHVDSTGEIIPDQAEFGSLMANVPPTAMVPDRSSLHARLTSAKKHVVCGRHECGARMAYVGHPTAEEIAHSEQTGASALACFQFLPGWAPGRDGIWAFSSYAKLRKQRGQSIKVRRYPMNDGSGPSNSVMDSYYELLPARAKCARCDCVNLLTAEDLGTLLVVLVPAPPIPARKTVPSSQ